jgi:hypothetical protein
MNLQKNYFKKLQNILILLVGLFLSLFNFSPVFGESLQSNNFIIEDASVTTGSGIFDSTNYSLAGSMGEITSDDRLMSGTYELTGGEAGGVVASVPKITCFETTTTNITTSCLSLPNSKGMQGECGSPGCFNKAKIEIDNQNNPYDTLYLVKIEKLTDNTTYYLKSDHTLGLSFTISNFMTKCAIEGKDLNNPGCDTNTDSDWNPALQSSNVFYLTDNTEYRASVSALNGDFTGTDFSPTANTITKMQSIGLDIDVGPASTPDVNSNAPYTINLSEISPLTPYTAPNLIWLDLASNNSKGLSVYIKDTNNGLFSISKNATIPSENEDLSLDPNFNGGYGVKVYNGNTTQTALGPLQRAASYNTVSDDFVGSLLSTNKLLFFTNDSGENKGEIMNGRGGIMVKARATASTPISSDYSDDIYFTIIGNY